MIQEEVRLLVVKEAWMVAEWNSRAAMTAAANGNASEARFRTEFSIRLTPLLCVK